MDRMFSVEEMSDQLWSSSAPPVNEADDDLSKMNRSASECAFQRFLPEASPYSPSPSPPQPPPPPSSSSTHHDAKQSKQPTTASLKSNVAVDRRVTGSGTYIKVRKAIALGSGSRVIGPGSVRTVISGGDKLWRLQPQRRAKTLLGFWFLLLLEGSK